MYFYNLNIYQYYSGLGEVVLNKVIEIELYLSTTKRDRCTYIWRALYIALRSIARKWYLHCYRTTYSTTVNYPDSKVYGANMGPIWGRQDPGGPHVGPMNFAIWVAIVIKLTRSAL